MPSEQPKLVIDKDSWHYRYFLFVRGLWGAGSPPEKTSLCPYFQTMLWGTLVVAAMSPVLVVGWVFMKGGRTLYKLLVMVKADWFIDWFDDTIIGSALAKSDETIKEAPVPATFVSFIFGLICLVAMIMALSLPFYLLFLTATTITSWPAALWACGVAVFSSIFWLFARIGQLGSLIAQGVEWFLVKTGELLSSIFAFLSDGTMWAAVGGWAAVSLAILAAILGAGYIGMLAANTRLGQRIRQYLFFHLNGYKDARARTIARRAAMQAAPPKPKEKSFVRKVADRIMEKVSNFFGRLCGKTKVVGTGAAKVLTGFGILWHFIVAMKHKACPMVEFSGKSDEHEQVGILVNGTKVLCPRGKAISYAEVCVLAGASCGVFIEYYGGPDKDFPDNILHEGQTVEVKEGMRFLVSDRNLFTPSFKISTF